MLGKPKTVGRKKWEDRAKEMLSHNIQLQTFGKQAMTDHVEIHKIASEQLDKLRLLLLPGVQEAFQKIWNITQEYLPETLNKVEEPQGDVLMQIHVPIVEKQNKESTDEKDK